MAIDSQSGAKPVAHDDSGLIDNEIPAYRALTPLAVLSLVFGIVSVLTFTELGFSLFGVAGILFGVLAHRKIRAFPELYTGDKLANAGIAVSLMFVLCAWTITLMQGWMITRAADKFGEQYVKAIKSGSFDELAYYQATPDQRKGKTAQKVASEMMEGVRAQREFEMIHVGLTHLFERVKTAKDQLKIDYEGVTNHASDGLQVKAIQRFAVTGPVTKDFPEATQYAGVFITGLPKNNEYEWFVTSVDFPVVEKK